MQSSENLIKSCQCRNTIKLKILEIINSSDKPFNIINLVEHTYIFVKTANPHIIIDDLFLKTYLRSIISEMVDSKLISLQSINKKEIEEESLYYVQLNLLNLSLLSEGKEINIEKKKDSKEENKENSEPAEKRQHESEKSIKSTKLDKEDSTNKKQVSDLSENDKLVQKSEMIDKLFNLRKKLEKLKKENKTKKLHNEIHKYNEIKDVGQELLGFIARTNGKKIKELYTELDISDDDEK